MSDLDISLDLVRLRRAYADGLSPETLIAEVLARVARQGEDAVWISRFTPDVLLQRARGLAVLPAAERARLTLFGVPFSVKDCIDVAGLPTTAACPAFADLPARSHPAVERLEAAGAIVIGKTNLDQFATGLNGTRSPYGVPRNPFDHAFIPGGSSSGAAVSVSAGLVSFALGTDTGGSGRVPAALTNVVGLKPTRGRFSSRGTVPACRSIETVSVFALTAPDALRVLDAGAAFDPQDPFARPAQERAVRTEGFRFGVPAELEFFGDAGAQALFTQAVATLEALGGTPRPVDWAAFRALNDLLFGPWLAERYAAHADFLARAPDGPLPLIRSILEGGQRFSGADVFAAQHRRSELALTVDALWRDMDVLAVPTTPTTYRIAEMLADPIGLNARLGTYTNFVNLADLAGVATPNGILPNGLPQGITLLGPAWSERGLVRLADRFHRRRGLKLGACAFAPP